MGLVLGILSGTFQHTLKKNHAILSLNPWFRFVQYVTVFWDNSKVQQKQEESFNEDKHKRIEVSKLQSIDNFQGAGSSREGRLPERQ